MVLSAKPLWRDDMDFAGHTSRQLAERGFYLFANLCDEPKPPPLSNCSFMFLRRSSTRRCTGRGTIKSMAAVLSRQGFKRKVKKSFIPKQGTVIGQMQGHTTERVDVGDRAGNQ